MSSYSYTDKSTIDRITFKTSEGGQLRAYIEADPASDGKLLAKIKLEFADRGWQLTPYQFQGKPALEVLGMRSEKQLIQLCQEQGWVTGQAQFIPDKEQKTSFWETLKKRSLGITGLWYVIGDVSFAMYGYKGGSALNMAAGGFYGAGTAALLTGGRKDQSDIQVRDVANKLARYMRENGHQLDSNCSLEVVTKDHDRGVIKTVDDFVRRYPSEMLNMFFAAAGTCIALAAHKQLKAGVSVAEIEDVFSLRLKDVQQKIPHTTISNTDSAALRSEIEHALHVNHKRESWLDIGLGTMTAGSGLFAASVKEKAPDPDTESKQGVEWLWEKIREKPLALASAGLMVSTLCHAVSTAIAWKYASSERRNSIPWRATFVATNLAAEVFLAISSKGHGEGVISDGAVDDTVIALAAENIAKQPKAMQNAVIDLVSEFLGRPDVLALKNDELRQKLSAQVEHIRGNPWAHCHAQERTVNAPENTAASRINVPPATGPWVAKVNTPVESIVRPGV